MGRRLRFQARRADITLSERKVKALLIGALVALSVGCGGTGDRSEARSSLPVLASVAADPLPAEAVVASRSWSAAEATGAATPSRAAEATRGVASASSDGSAAAAAPAGPTARRQAVQGRGEATTSGATATVEDLLEDGLYGAGASPAHVAIRGTPAATSVRCAWRGIARTAAQREDAIRFWLRLDAAEAMPSVGALEVLFAVVLDALDPYLRETAKANFLAIARGGESRDYLFLTCFADYAVTSFLLGSGTTPATVTVAYDRRDEAASYDLYVREHEAGTNGSDPLQTRGAYEAGLQARVVAAEKALGDEIGGREAVIFLAPMGAHNAIGFEAWQAVASWAVVTDDAGVVQAVRDDTPAGDPEHTQPLANLSSRISTAATTDAHATTRVTTVGGLQPYYRDTLQAYADITPGDGQTTTFTPAQPPAAPTCTNGTVIPNPADNRELVTDCETLLAVGPTLRGSAALNWSTDTALTSWTGVTTGGTPTRVTGLNLASQSLRGSIPSEIGHLFGLTTLNLSGNSLTGNVPAELGWLDQLTELRLSGNTLTGCVPLNLRAVATNDLSSLNLPFCAPPPPANLRAGTPAATSVAVSWDAVADAAAYRVEVREGATGTWTTHRDVITGTSHTVDGLVCQTAYALRVRARGSGTTYGTAWSQPSGSVAVTTGTCPPPAFAASSYSFTVAEDFEAGVQVGIVRATVAGGGPVTHTLTAGNTGDVWALDANTGELKVAGPLDYETTPTYTLTVTADGGAGGTATTTVTVTVTNVDEPPGFEAESYAFSVAEDAALNTTVGTVTANDPEGGTVIYDITAGDAAGQWAVDALAGTLVLGGRLDYETTAAYTLTVRALVLGGGPAAGTTTVTVTVTDVADAPPPPANLAATPAVTSLALSWAAVPGATKYQVDYRTSGAETWTTAADDVTTATTTLAELTCGTAYEVRVRAFGSGAGYTDTWSAPAAVAATTSTCPPPVFGAESYSFSVAENSAAATAVGTVTATTTGSGSVTYAITVGNDAAAFALDAETGALTVAG
ncbi:MAG: cadherin domain-containing protein, partial [Chloroflexi bacterium]|nr:cadherin domain-containing protein [Chloroflexota bacterium]